MKTPEIFVDDDRNAELVTQAADGLDVGRQGAGLFELFTQPHNLHFERGLAHGCAASGDDADHFFDAQALLYRLGKSSQQQALGIRDVDRGLWPLQLQAGGVERALPDAGLKRMHAPLQRPDSRAHFIERGGFGQHQVRTALVGADQLIAQSAWGDDDDANAGLRSAQAAHLAEGVGSGHRKQQDVGASDGLRVIECPGAGHRMAHAAQRHDGGFTHHIVNFNDQDTQAAHGASAVLLEAAAAVPAVNAVVVVATAADCGAAALWLDIIFRCRMCRFL